jgi:hypothetical protein
MQNEPSGDDSGYMTTVALPFGSGKTTFTHALACIEAGEWHIQLLQPPTKQPSQRPAKRFKKSGPLGPRFQFIAFGIFLEIFDNGINLHRGASFALELIEIFE